MTPYVVQLCFLCFIKAQLDLLQNINQLRFSTQNYHFKSFVFIVKSQINMKVCACLQRKIFVSSLCRI